MTDGDFDIDKYRLPKEAVPPLPQPKKVLKRRRDFIMVPFSWLERLEGAHGQTYRLALAILYLTWKAKGEPVKLANTLSGIQGVSRQAKRRGLADLERRGLVVVERRPRKSPLVRLA
jgi:hypothetical protein